MSMTDPIADMLTRIRNGQLAKEHKINMPGSIMKIAILEVLKKEGYIESFEVKQENNKKSIEILLKYYQGEGVIEAIQRISKPSLRIYRKCSDLPQVRAGMGIAIISTSKGVMSEKAARAQRLGGEVLCIVE